MPGITPWLASGLVIRKWGCFGKQVPLPLAGYPVQPQDGLFHLSDSEIPRKLTR